MRQFTIRALLGFIVVMLFSITMAHAVNPYTYVPKNAIKYLPILDDQVSKFFTDFPDYAYFGGLIEQESCIALTYHSCWNPKTQLLTSREQGAGLAQLTRAFRKDGSVRFDSLEAIREQHMKELKDLSWSNILVRPDLQMRAMILMSKDNYKRLYMVPKPIDRIAFTDSAYNGGLSGLFRDRRLCGLMLDCDPNIWFGNVERTCSKSKAPIYGHESPCDINRTHVSNILKIRMKKYAKYMKMRH